MLMDLRYALHLLVSRRWFSAAIIVTLGLSIGLNTTVFTLMSAALLKPVPLPRGDRLVAIVGLDPKNPQNHLSLSLPDFRDLQAQSKSFSGLEASQPGQAIISEPSNPPDRYPMATVSTGLFEMLRTSPILGRPFTATDGLPGSPTVALVSRRLWQKRYALDPGVIGRVVRVNGAAATIIGVMPAGFAFPGDEDLWLPLVPTEARRNRADRELILFGILAPHTSVTAAQSELDVAWRRLAQAFPDEEKGLNPVVQTLQQTFNGGPIRAVFLLAQGAVVFVLLIACANVANMMLSRAQGRSREIALRAALGASRFQIIRQLLVESVLLSSLGGILGLALAHYGVRAFDLATQDVGKPYWVQFAMDWRAFTYFAALSVGTGLVFGIGPAWRASRQDLNAALKDGAAGGTARAGRLAGALVALQFALTVVLLGGAGLVLRSYFIAARVNPFVPASQILTARVSLPDGKGERYESVESRRDMHRQTLERLRALPGVEDVAIASNLPGLGSQDREIEVDGRPNPDPKHPPQAAAVFISPNYLSLIGLPIQSGRGLNARDGGEGREAAVVTRRFARRYLPGNDPIGRRFRFVPEGKPGPWITVVGVSGDVVQDTMQPDPPPLVYLSSRQEPWAWMGILVRTRAEDPGPLTSAVRSALQQIDPDLPLFDTQTLVQAISHEHWFLRVFGSMFLLFAAIALVLASVGVYAVVAQVTARRTREIGIRMALGASARRVVGLVLSNGLWQMAVGLPLGLAGAVMLARQMAGLPGISPDGGPLTLAAVLTLLLVIGLFASWLPARRAARIAPSEALRND